MSAQELREMPIDTLAMRLWQVQGSLIAISNNYDEEVDEFRLAPKYMWSALCAAIELIRQAQDAFDREIDEQNAKRKENAQ